VAGNSEADRWTLHITTADGTRILDGALLAMNVDLLRTIPATFAYVPPGTLFLGGVDDPTLDTIDNAILFYAES